MLLVQLDLTAYPLREFPKASELNIPFKVVWTPVASGLYYIYRPRGKKLTKCFYFAAWISLLTLIDGLLAANTELVKQWMTCIFGHAMVELNLLAYPVREFADVNRFPDSCKALDSIRLLCIIRFRTDGG
ncbi:CBO0543 family protein [Cohnella candidum]|uniref:CBO0543 family protein n=1 Tax=Cohnella candidum TaxID=2674991 RepID=UPI001F150E4F|nr:CBO0543 family protein [Cohnella candidum]